MGKRYIKRICKRCGETIYKFYKDDNTSELMKGAKIALHMMTCDRERYDTLISEFFIKVE